MEERQRPNPSKQFEEAGSLRYALIYILSPIGKPRLALSGDKGILSQKNISWTSRNLSGLLLLACFVRREDVPTQCSRDALTNRTVFV